MNLNGGLMGSSTKMTRPKPDPFPVGLRVLVVDDDPTCLIILEKMLRTCRYHVTKTNRAEIALTWLRENKNGFDVVISDVHMPDMDGFKLLEHVGLEMDLPVIMMSADDSNNVVMKGVTHGACDYLIKPVRIEALKNIWQHVIRKKNENKDVDQSGSFDEGDRQQKQDDTDSPPPNEESWKSSKRKGEDEDSDEKDDSNAPKKSRVVWSVELHQQFVAAVNQLGIEKAVPKKILEMMNVPGLTRENVASHLQKYRLYLRRLSGVSQYQGGLNGSFMSQDSGFGTMSSLGGFDLQALHANGQLSSQTLTAAYTRLPPTVKPSISMPYVDQRNVFNFGNSMPRYGDAHQQNLSHVSKHMNLLHGIPTTMEPKQLAGFSQSSIGQSSAVVSRNGMGYNPMSQPSSVVDYSSINQIPDLQSGSFPLGSTPRITSMTSRGFNQEETNLDTKSVRGYVGSYEAQDWQHATTSVHNTLNVPPSVLVNQSYVNSQKIDQNRNVLGGNLMFSNGLETSQHLGMPHINHNVNVNVVHHDNTPRVKAEMISDIVSPGTDFFSEHYDQDDLMSALLKQQEGFEAVDYDFDGFTLDNVPVHD